jgi:type VI secretion system protein ImpF
MQHRQNSRATVLDRLVDMEPGVSHEPVQRRLLDIRQVKDVVIRDLENLFNTRRQILSVPASYKEVNNSVFMYGLGDFTAENPKNSSVRQRIRQDVEKAISRFEPRLKNVTVRLEEDIEEGRNLRFRISGMLVVEPEIEPVSFDTYFDTNRGEYVIER